MQFNLSFYIFSCLCNVLSSMEIEFVSKKTRAFGTTSGIAVTDLEDDGNFEIIVAVYDGPNKILTFDWDLGDYIDVSELNPAFTDILDSAGNAISVCACDIDGDGLEEIYIHNDNPLYPVRTDGQTIPDRLFKYVHGKYMDLFSTVDNALLAPKYGGTSVACIDRTGHGLYDFIINTFTPEGIGTYRVMSLDSEKTTPNRTILKDVSNVFGTFTDKAGQGILVGSILVDDIKNHVFITNDNMYHKGSSFYRHESSNVFLKNNRDGIFSDVALELGLTDHNENGRGALITDLNEDGRFDLLYANWQGPTRIFLQNQTGQFHNVVDKDFCLPSATDFLLVADFNNDGYSDIVKSNSGDGISSPNLNQLYTVIYNSDTEDIEFFDIYRSNVTMFQDLRIRGMGAADINNDGLIELLVGHYPYNQKSFSILSVNHSENNWIRIMPLTIHGAPARGSLVSLTIKDNERRIVIGGDCSYLCQSEPVAHFGLGQDFARELSVTWPNGHEIHRFLYKRDHRLTLIISYYGIVTYKASRVDQQNVVSASYHIEALLTNILVLSLLTIHVYSNTNYMYSMIII